MSDLRKAFFDNMCDLAEKDKDVVLITGDLGYSFIENYIEKYPDQFINAGCMEQSMVGIATGMAQAGKKPYVYSGAIFILMRPYEQVRDDVAYNNMNVKLVGTKASGFLGFTHNLQGTENTKDLLKNLPNIESGYPESEEELKEFMNKTYLLKVPTYIQL
jgi:transketolase